MDLTQHTLQPLAHAIRFLAVDAIVRAGEGHQGVPLGMAEIATALYAKHLKFDSSDPEWFDRDRVVVSNGHGSMLLYALLYLAGYQKISIEQIKTFRELGSHCAGHPERDIAAGIEVTTGPLGQGIGNAFGMAVAEAFLNAKFGDEIVNHHTYAFVGDGCLQEGVGQEMISLAGHLQLGKLILLWDDNRITDDGSTNLSISENVADRFKIANWHVMELDGHDIQAVVDAIQEAKNDPRPSLLDCRTVIAKGIERLQGQRGGHSSRLFEEDACLMRQRLNWSHDAFDIPVDVLSAWRKLGHFGNKNKQAWQARLNALPTAKRMECVRFMQGHLPQGWVETLEKFKACAVENKLSLGGINLSAEINDLLTDVLPERMVSCADLEGPTDHKKRLSAFTADDRSGAYVHCGVREHLMGTMVNGMAAHGGVIPISVTYLAFSDYERPALRMAAMMGLPVKFVFSHDSIGAGKGGATHQPVEILSSLRAMPNMWVMRPADAVEAVECWQTALGRKDGPVSLIFARQVLPLVRNYFALNNLSSKGGYILEDAKGTNRKITLIATGSEVQLALRAREILQDQGIETAVVSMPCWELFEQQDASYKNSVLPRQGVRVAVEAALRFGWDRYLGDSGGFVGMQGFGASGSAEELYDHFGITSDAVVTEAKRCLEVLSQ